MEKLTLKRQFIIYFVLIIFLSLAATIAQGVISYVLYAEIQNEWTKPANYYEKKIPDIKEMIKSRGTVLLNINKKQYLDKEIPSKGIQYQVFDLDGNYIYGTYKARIIKSRRELYEAINLDDLHWTSVKSIIPLIDKYGTIKGGVLLTYKVNVTYSNNIHRIIIVVIGVMLLLAPFMYVSIFTLLFSRRFVKGINYPISLLKEASQKIQKNDLDFSIDYAYNNELGELCSDFNEMKTALQNSLETQWRAEQERQENLQALAHDLKTPLSIIQGYTEALLSGNWKDGEKAEKYIKIINENSIKSSNIVKEMQYISEIDSNEFSLEIREFNLEEFLNNKVDEYKLLSVSKGIDIITNITKSEDSTDIYSLDEEKLDRILDNIITNSIRYTPYHGTVEIGLNLEKESVNFRIVNSGKPFTPEELNHIFNKFYRGDKSRNSKDGHMGLGLYIVSKLVELQKGKIEASNTEEGKARVSFTLYI